MTTHTLRPAFDEAESTAEGANKLQLGSSVALAGFAPSFARRVDVRYSSSLTSGNDLVSLSYINQTTATTGGPQGSEGYVVCSHSSGTVALPIAMVGNIEVTGAGTVTEARGFTTTLVNSSTGSIGSGVGYYVANPVNTGGGTLSTYYGLKIANLTGAGLNYAIYTGTGLVVFGGGVSCGSTLLVSGATTLQDTLAVGGAATVTGNLTVNSKTTVSATTGFIAVPESGPASPQLGDANQNGFWTAITSGDEAGIAVLGQEAITAASSGPGNVQLSFYGEAPQAKQEITGARDDPEEALAALLTALELYGLITDSTTAS